MSNIDIAQAIEAKRKVNQKVIFVIPGGDAKKAREEAQAEYPFHSLKVVQWCSHDGKPHIDRWLKLERDWY